MSQAVTRSCETSNHHLIGTLRLVDGSIRENVVVPFHGVEPVMADGYHWFRPPMARRDACEAEGAFKVYEYPIRYGSYNTLLDWCYRWGNQCGEQAAQTFCEKEGYARQIYFSGPRNITTGEKTRIVSSKEICDQPSCGTFAQITCRGW